LRVLILIILKLCVIVSVINSEATQRTANWTSVLAARWEWISYWII